MRFNGVCRAYFFFGWTALWIGAELVVLAAFRLRAPEGLKMYLFEAMIAILAPFIALGIGDSLSMNAYRKVWNDMHGQLLTVVFIDRDVITRLRADLVVLASWTFNNTRLLLLSKIGGGQVGRNLTHQTATRGPA